MKLNQLGERRYPPTLGKGDALNGGHLGAGKNPAQSRKPFRMGKTIVIGESDKIALSGTPAGIASSVTSGVGGQMDRNVAIGLPRREERSRPIIRGIIHRDDLAAPICLMLQRLKASSKQTQPIPGRHNHRKHWRRRGVLGRESLYQPRLEPLRGEAVISLRLLPAIPSTNSKKSRGGG